MYYSGSFTNVYLKKNQIFLCILMCVLASSQDKTLTIEQCLRSSYSQPNCSSCSSLISYQLCLCGTYQCISTSFIVIRLYSVGLNQIIFHLYTTQIKLYLSQCYKRQLSTVCRDSSSLDETVLGTTSSHSHAIIFITIIIMIKIMISLRF